MSQATLLPSSPAAPSFPPLAYKGIPVLTTEMLAQAYEVQAKQIRQNFANNRERFVEGKHFFQLSGHDLKEFKNCVEKFDSVKLGRRTPSLTLWTERGAARNAKMLNSDRAWDVFELLEETFFRVVRKESESRPLAEDMVLPEPELPAAERLPLFRNGCFYLPGINKNHVPGPREAALMDLWQTWNRQTASMEREFMGMMRELERRRGDLFAVAVSELGRDADTAFSFESLMEGLFCAHDMALRYFKEAISLQRLSLRLSVNVAVALGR